MSLLGNLAKMDSALQRGLDNSFALVFGGRLVPAEIEELLKQEIEDNLEFPRGRPEAPNVFEVGVSGKDLENLSQTNAYLAQDFADQMTRFCRNHGWALPGPVVVRIAEESGLRTGQLRVSSYQDADPQLDSGFDAIAAYPSREANAPAASNATSGRDEGGEMNSYDPYQHDSARTEFFESPSRGQSNTGSLGRRPPAPVSPTVSLLLQDGSSRTYLVQEGSNIIGRSNDADFRLPDTGVSRQHAEVSWDGQDAVLTDLQSTNGTTVNDTPVDNWLLADGDVITIGHSHIEVRIVWPQGA